MRGGVGNARDSASKLNFFGENSIEIILFYLLRFLTDMLSMKNCFKVI